MNETNGAARSLTMSPSIQELAKALIAVQAELPTLLKDKVARTEKFSYAYIGLDIVMPAALKVLTKNGLGLVQSVGNDGTGTTLTSILIHESGEWLADTQPLLLVRADPQGQGSAITYARRYGLMAMIGLVAEEDDDGQAAMRPPARSRAPARTAPAPTDNSAPITQTQIRSIHGALSRMFGNDEQRQYEWIKRVMPRACEASPTEFHLGELTKAEANTILNASLVDQQTRPVSSEGAQQAPLAPAATPNTPEAPNEP